MSTFTSPLVRQIFGSSSYGDYTLGLGGTLRGYLVPVRVAGLSWLEDSDS